MAKKISDYKPITKKVKPLTDAQAKALAGNFNMGNDKKKKGKK